MNKPFVGYDKKYSANFDKIFKKSLLKRIGTIIDKFLFSIFLEEKKVKC